MRIASTTISAISLVAAAKAEFATHRAEANSSRQTTAAPDAIKSRPEIDDPGGAIDEDGGVTSGVTISGEHDLRSFASPRDAGIDTHSGLSIKVGDGTWVKVQFESFQRISVTKDGLTTLFSYTSASGSWPESLVSAFNSIGGGLTSSISSGGQLQLTSDQNGPIQIVDGSDGAVNLPAGLANALGLPEGPSTGRYSGEGQAQSGHRLAAGPANLISDAPEHPGAGKDGVFPLARDAYAEIAEA